MKTQHLIYCLAIAVLFTACKKDDNGQSVQVRKDIFSGYAQKGPFVNGASVTISELKENLDQTGKTYSTTIAGDLGNFEQKNIELESKYVELKADGFYFNEILGQTSNAQMTLYALADIENVNSVNVNVLTHLEKSRVEYLVKQERMDFTVAKQQAQREVLSIFGFEPFEMPSEELELTIDAKLLAISCILQSYLSTGDMMELMANISADIKEDGKLDISLGWKLLNNAYKLPPLEIRKNLTKKYTELGIDVTIPDFESYIELFINSGIYQPLGTITYPEEGTYGINILSDEVTEVWCTYPETNYSVIADVPQWQTLKIVIKDCMHSVIYAINWNLSVPTRICTEFTIIESGKISDAEVSFSYDFDPENPLNDAIIEFYENGATIPTKTKQLKLLIQND